MTVRERALLFDCEGEALVGVLAEPTGQAMTVGVLVVVGGPQYRVGSHRQFVLLARDLAAQGVACLRFDVRGMGDSTGAPIPFDGATADLRAAIDAFVAEVPGLENVVLWGLCDGASAASLYAPTDARVCGLIVLNPWVRTEAIEARAYVRHYYGKRLLGLAFWKKLLGGRVNLRSALSGLGRNLKAAQGARSDTSEAGLPVRMAAALEAANVPMLVVLSGRDQVAREFEDLGATDPRWRALLDSAASMHLEEADHTFSDRRSREAVSRRCREWVAALAERPPENAP